MPLVERLRQGLSGAVLSAAALAAPTDVAAAPGEPRLVKGQGTLSRPAKTTSTKPTAPKATAPAKGTAPAAAGCGAHDGGCGPSR